MSSASPPISPTLNPAGYARWWVDELRALLPSWMTAWFAGDGALVDIGADDTSLHVMNLNQGRARITQSIPRAELSTHPVLRDLVAKEQDRVRLLLTQGQVLVRTLTLPAAIEENLVEAIGFEIDRVTPFKADQVYYAAKVSSRDAQKETVDVLLAVLPRARLEPLMSAARQAGLSVVEAGAEPGLTGGQFIDLLPAGMKPARKWGQMTRINLALAAAAAVLLLLALLLPVWQKRERVIALIPMVDKTASEFATNRKIYDDYARLAGEFNYIATRKHALQPVMAVIEEVTRMSPDTTFTQSLELKSSGKVRELVMMGEAASASRVIESLEQSPLFQNASQKSQTTRGSQSNTERFHVATEVKPRPVPAAMLVELETVPTAPPSPSPAVSLPVPAIETKAGAPELKAVPGAGTTMPPTAPVAVGQPVASGASVQPGATAVPNAPVVAAPPKAPSPTVGTKPANPPQPPATPPAPGATKGQP